MKGFFVLLCASLMAVFSFAQVHVGGNRQNDKHIYGIPVDTTGRSDEDVLLYDRVTERWIMGQSVRGGSGYTDSLHHTGTEKEAVTNLFESNWALKKSMAAVADTAALKQISGQNGDMRYLTALGSSGISGGWFTLMDSTYKEGLVAFSAGISGKQWVRQEWQDNHVLNIKWSGATGDSLTDDRANILKALHFVENYGFAIGLYFPPGVYGISNGLTMSLPIKSGKVSVFGDGQGISKLCLISADTNTIWHALRIAPATTPTSEQDYLRDISIYNMSFEDADAQIHSGETEETHGINVQYTRGVHIHHVTVKGVGDEGIEVDYCRNVNISHCTLDSCKLMMDTSGGAISIKQGCREVMVSHNIIRGTVGPNGIGVNVKIMAADSVRGLIIDSNIIDGSAYAGFNINTSAAPATNVIFSNNIVRGGSFGFIKKWGTYFVRNLRFTGNTFFNVDTCAYVGGYSKYVEFHNNTLDDVIYGFYINADNVTIDGDIFTNIASRAIFAVNSDTLSVKNVDVYQANTNGSTSEAIYHANGSLSGFENIKIFSDSTLTAIKGRGATTQVRNCRIRIKEGGAAVQYANIIQGVTANGRFEVEGDNAIVCNNRIATSIEPGTDYIRLINVEDGLVCGNYIGNAGTRYGIDEEGSSDYNIICNNNLRDTNGIRLVGTHTDTLCNMLP